MKTLIKIAWRSLWRNRRRTFLTTAAVILSLVLSLFMRSMQFGSYEQMIKAGVNQTGHLQVHDTGYQANQTIDRSFFYTKSLGEKIRNMKDVRLFLPHLQTFSLASYGEKTKGVLVSGIDAKGEDKLLGISKKMVRGKYLSGQEQGVIIGDKLAQYLKLKTGDSLVLIGQGYQGITAYGIYPVRGIFHLPSLKMNSQVVFMNLTDAQSFVYPYRPGLCTGISVFLRDPDKLKSVQQRLEQTLRNHFEVISWKIMLSDLLQTIKVDNASGQIMLMVLYLIAAFGIFSTVLMMTMEKRRQYAVMISLGMQRSKLVKVSVIETFIISLLGILAGLVVISPILFYLHLNPIPISGEMAKVYLQFNIEPILPFSVKPHIFISQTAIILTLSLLSALYPIIYISRFNILNAFRH